MKQHRILSRLIASAVILVLAAAILIAAAFKPDFSQDIRAFSVTAMNFIAFALSFSASPVAEYIIFLLIAIAAVVLIYSVARYRLWGLARAGAMWLLIFSIVLLIACPLFLVRYTAPSLGDTLGLDTSGGYTVTQLTDTAKKLRLMLNTSSTAVPRVEDGTMDLGGWSHVGDRAISGYRALSRDHEVFNASLLSNPKASKLLTNMMSKVSVAGYYFPFTGEATVCAAEPAAQVPFDMAHELAHTMGIAREDEANFAAFLACEAATDQRLQYSGYLAAYLYTINALWRHDAETAQQIHSTISLEARADIQALNDYINQNKGALSTVGESVNNAYIKVTGQPDGIQSYGRMVDLLIAYYYG